MGKKRCDVFRNLEARWGERGTWVIHEVQQRTTSVAMRSAKDRRTPAAGGKTRTAREPCSRSASRTRPMKASMASKFKLPSELFRSRHSHSFGGVVNEHITYVKLSRGLCALVT